jgi:hypothetical protein
VPKFVPTFQLHPVLLAFPCRKICTKISSEALSAVRCSILYYSSTLMRDNHFVLNFRYRISHGIPSICFPSYHDSLPSLHQVKKSSFTAVLPSLCPFHTSTSFRLFAIPFICLSYHNYFPSSSNGGRFLVFSRKS